MIILHYFLGFPPYRSGGLTRYAMDLMKSQVENGDEVLALWPGEIQSYSRQPRIRFRGTMDGIRSFELLNPLPVSLDEGIIEFEAFWKTCDRSVYNAFLREVHPDAIHIHTLMGLHREFVQAADELGMRTVYTTHDYFGLCPKITFYRFGSCCEDDHGCADCVLCNREPLSLNRIRIMQSPLYRRMKDSALMRKLRKQHRVSFFADEEMPEMPKVDAEKLAGQYRKLRSYYVDMLEQIDMIHFNSRVTEQVFRRYITPRDSRVITITHRSIADHRAEAVSKCSMPDGKLHILYLAPARPFKGYYILKEALDQLWAEGKRDFVLHIYDALSETSPYMVVKEGGYHYEQLGGILLGADVLVAPSAAWETFGFTVLEAISYNLPVIVSDHIGAKDIAAGAGIVVPAGSVDALKRAVCDMTPQTLDGFRETIQQDLTIKSWDEFLQENRQLYRK